MELFYSQNNTNKIDQDTYDRIKIDVQRNGFLDPNIYIASDGEIISGNHRYKIAQELGQEYIDQLKITNLGDLSELEKFRLSEMYNTRGVSNDSKLMIKCYLLYQKEVPEDKKLTKEYNKIHGTTLSLIANQIAVTPALIRRYVKTGHEMFENHPWLINEVGSAVTPLMIYYLVSFNKTARIMEDHEMSLEEKDKFIKEFVEDAKEHYKKTGRPMGADKLQATIRNKFRDMQGTKLANLEDAAWASIWYPLKRIETLRHVIEDEVQLGTYSRDLLKMKPQGKDVGMNRDRRVSSFHQSITFQLIRLLTRNYQKDQTQTFDKFTIVDPCCGKGIRVATPLMMGHEAYGYDISKDTIDEIKEKLYPEYANNFFVHDSVNNHLPHNTNSVDLVFTCPPYWNIEKYEDVPGQLSSLKKYEDFLIEYEKLIIESIRISKKYVVFVVANFRGNNKEYYPFCYDTESLLNKHGMKLWDKIILGHDISKPTGGTKSLMKNHTRSAHDEMFIFKKIYYEQGVWD